MGSVKKILIVPYCHPDWAWTAHRRWHEKRYVLVLEEVLDLLKEHPGFRWYLDTYVTQLGPVLRRIPGRFEELRERVHEGKIGICGSFTNLRPSMVGEETQVRDLVIGGERYRELFPDADLSVYAGTVDVSVGHPQVPQLLALCGYEYLRFWRPYDALSAKRIPLEFFWEGLDGSRVLCARGRYDGDAFSGVTDLSEGLKREITHDEGLSPTGVRWVTQGGDDCRPLRTYEDQWIPLFDFVDQWNKEETVPLRFATPAEFFRELEVFRDRVPVVSGTLDPCEVCYNVGWGGSHGLFSFRQRNEGNLTDAEKWLAVASLYEYPYDEARLRGLWERHLLSCAHATQWLFEEDFGRLHKVAMSVESESERVRNGALDLLAGLVSADKHAEFVLFNPFPFERTQKVPLVFSFLEQPGAFRLVDGTGQEMPFQTSDTNEVADRVWEHHTVAKVKLPPLGYTTVSVRKGGSERVAESIPFRVHFEGSALALVEAGGERYSATAGRGFGDVRLRRVDTTKGVLCVGPIVAVESVQWAGTALKEDGPLFARYESEGRVGNHTVTRNTVVHKDEPLIEFHLEVRWSREDGFLTLEWPLVFEGSIWGDTPFGVEEKRIEEEPYGELPGAQFEDLERQREGLFFAKSFVNHTDGARSISYVNSDATRYYLRTEESMANLLLNSVTYRPGWNRFVNRNAMAEGIHTFTSYLMFHSGDWSEVNLPQRSQDLLGPVHKVFVDGASPGELPSCHSFLCVEPSSVILTGFYREADSFVLRFYEAAGKKTKAAIDLPFAPRRAEKISLCGEVLDSVCCGETIHVEVRPWEIVTLRLAQG
jgi:hypothetical protein